MTESMLEQQHASKEGRAIIDTTLPYSSVKGAMYIFDPKARGSEIWDGSDVLSPHSRSKRRSITDSQNQSSKQTCDDGNTPMEPNIKVAVQKSPSKQHMGLLAELRGAKKELEMLQQELLLVKRDKEDAMKQAEEARAVADINAKRFDELSNETLGANKSIQQVKLDCVDGNGDQSVSKTKRGELEDLKKTESTCPQAISIKKLQEELDFTKRELANMSEKKADARALIASLTLELEKLRADLRLAHLKVDQANMGLSQILQETTDEDRMMKKKAFKVAIDSEHAKAELCAIFKEAEVEGHKLSSNKAVLDAELQKLRNMLEPEVLAPPDIAIGFGLKGTRTGGRVMTTQSFDRRMPAREAREPPIARVFSSKIEFSDQNVADGELLQKTKKKKQLLLRSVISFLGKNKKAP